MISRFRLVLLTAVLLLSIGSEVFVIGRSQTAIAQSVDSRKVEGDRLSRQGDQQFQASQFGAAIYFWQQALTIYREIKDRQGEVIALGNIGLAYLQMGNYTKTIQYGEQLLWIARETKDRQSEAMALSNLGLAYLQMGNYTKTIQYQQKFLAITQEIKDRKNESRALGNLGLAYFSLGNYAQAIEYYQQVLAINQLIKDRKGEGKTSGNLGLAYHLLGNYAKAIEYQQQSLVIAQEVENRQGEGASLGNLGASYFSLGDYVKAIEYAQQRLVLAQETEDIYGKSIALGNLGNAYSSLGNYAEAIKYYQQVLTTNQIIHDRRNEGITLGNLGIAYYSLGNYAKAIEYQQQSLVIAREIKNQQGEGDALNNLGVALFKSGDSAAAEKVLLNAVVAHESIRRSGAVNDVNKISIFELQSNTYRSLQQVLVAANKPNVALEISERGRSRAFVDLLTQRLIPNAKQTLSAQPPTLAQLQQIAKTQDAVLVEYSVIGEEDNIESRGASRKHIYSWVVKPTGEVVFRKVDFSSQSGSLIDLVTGTRQAIGITDRATIVATNSHSVLLDKAKQTQQLQKLHKLLIDPIADLLPTDPNQNVIFIPQGALFSVPFAALQDQNGKYLIEKHTILTAPSIQVLELTRQQRNKSAKSGKALVMGNPTMPIVQSPGGNAQQLPKLAGAETEARAIAPLLNTTALIGAQGTKATIKQQMLNAHIIHLATHGLLDDVNGLGSAIALAPDNPGQPNDGLLTAEEILNMKLTANLVVLSACDTGRGRITGDGVIGLSRALISAGVPSVLVSLWSVPDAPTADLMTEFYKNLQERKLNKAQALREAMKTVMKTHPNPIDWAAFTLIGEAE